MICDKCDKCDKTFGTKSNLTRHIKTTHMTQQFPCEICDKFFLRKDNLKRHLYVCVIDKNKGLSCAQVLYY